MNTNVDRQLLSLEIKPDGSAVKIHFLEIITMAPLPNTDESRIKKVPLMANWAPFAPHKDLVDSMKKLRKHALALNEIELADESKDLADWSVLKLQIAGDILTKRSRANLWLYKYVKRTGKVSKMDVSQFTMYPSADDKVKYYDADKLTAIIEDIIEECWSYLDGKFAPEDSGEQMSIFPRKILLKGAA